MWDRVLDASGAAEHWGGLGYALCAAAAAAGPGWRVVPIAKVGRDLEDEARAFVATIPGVDGSALLPVPEPNNRVTLRYRDRAERVERLAGGVPTWRPDELTPRIRGCDALLVNFISGHEVTLDGCRAVREGFDGPIHADLHSLFLDTEPDGTRVPRPLPSFTSWVACFDSIQLNEVEAGLAGARPGQEDAFARSILALGPDVCSITRGAAGVSWAARDAARSGRWSTPVRGGGRVDSGSVTIRSPRQGDPTGCGDVWGAAFFARTLAGDPVPAAAEVATRLAARNVEHRGADALYHALAREVAP